jgi:hypothetical protein
MPKPIESKEIESSFWKLIERWGNIARIIQAIIALVPFVISAVKAIFGKPISSELVILALIFTFLAPLIIQRKGGILGLIFPKKIPIKIPFDYTPESPMKHGWLLHETAGEPPPSFDVELSGHYGKALKIISSAKHAFDYFIEPKGYNKKNISFLIKPNTQVLYIRIAVSSQDNTVTHDAWLNIGYGTNDPVEMFPWEWKYYVPLFHVKDGWYMVQVNKIDEAVKKSYGSKGWKLNRIIGIRLRGSMSIVSITLT